MPHAYLIGAASSRADCCPIGASCPAGAYPIVGIDVNPKKFALAKQLGCTECINPKDHSQPMQQVLVSTSPTGFGYDYTFDCTGNTDVRARASRPPLSLLAANAAAAPLFFPDKVCACAAGDALGARGSAPRLGAVHDHWRRRRG